MPDATGPKTTERSRAQVPIWVPSGEQTLSPAAVHEPVEAGDAEEALGEAAGVLGLAAAADGRTAATFSCAATEGIAAAADEAG